MKHGVNSYSQALILALTGLLAVPMAAWADANPDFDDDAKPILNMQPGLLHYVESRFEVKDTGTAKFPGDDDRRPRPPFIFRARPIGSSGPFSLRLLIQPGPPGHILGVVDINRVHLTEPGSPSSGPAVASHPTEPPPSAPTQATHAPSASVQVPELSGQPVEQQQTPAQQPAASQPTEPTADTPSGPIMDSSGQTSPADSQSNLAPPPDPAPATH